MRQYGLAWFSPWRCLVALIAGAALGAAAATALDDNGGLHLVAARLSARTGVPLITDHDLDTLVGSHWDTRDVIIRLQAAEAPKGALLLLGDSIIEGLWGEDLPVKGRRCAAVNAGFAGAGVAQLLRHERAALDEVQPRFVVLSIGFNDAWPGAPAANWATEYDQVVQQIVAAGATPILIPPLPPEPGYPKVTKSVETVAGFDREVRRIAARRGAILADVAADPLVANAIGSSGRTVDGVHPTGAFYRRMQGAWIAPAVAAAERRRGEPCLTVG